MTLALIGDDGCVIEQWYLSKDLIYPGMDREDLIEAIADRVSAAAAVVRNNRK